MGSSCGDERSSQQPRTPRQVPHPSFQTSLCRSVLGGLDTGLLPLHDPHTPSSWLAAQGRAHLLCVRMCFRIRLNLSEVPEELGKKGQCKLDPEFLGLWLFGSGLRSQ